MAEMWDKLSTAIDAREEGYYAAGAPGRAWDYSGNISDPHDALRRTKRFMTSFIEGFDTFSVSRMSEGKDAAHEPTPTGDEINRVTTR